MRQLKKKKNYRGTGEIMSLRSIRTCNDPLRGVIAVLLMK